MIAIDIDGVVADSEAYLVRQLEFYIGQDFVPSVPRTYDFRDGFRGLSLDDCLQNIDIALKRFSPSIPVHDYKRTYLALSKIQFAYDRVYFITARSKDLWIETNRWLERYFGCLDYTLYNVGHNADKEEWMINHGLTCIVEDRLKTVNGIQDPHYAYLINRPWNNGRDINNNVIRVNDLLEAVNYHLGEPYV